MDNNDGASLVTQRLQQFENDPFGGSVHARHRFVHEIQFGLLSQRASQENSLLLAAGKLTNLTFGIILHANALKALHRQIPLNAARTPKPAQRTVGSH